MNYYDGDSYEGEWRDDAYHGYGKFLAINGHVYEVEWANVKKEGKGA